MREAAFRVEGRVTEALPNGTFRVELANGHRLLAFATGRTRSAFVGVKPGDVVRVQLTPFDLSTGRMMVEQEKILK
jgi:translation initiation factor IF-1